MQLSKKNKRKQSDYKWAEALNGSFLKEFKWPRSTFKGFNITNLQGNANQNQLPITSYLSEWLSSKDRTHAGEVVKARECLCTVGERANFQRWRFLKIKTRTITWSSNSTSWFHKTSTLKRYLHPNVHYSIIHNSQDRETTYVSINGWIYT